MKLLKECNSGDHHLCREIIYPAEELKDSLYYSKTAGVNCHFKCSCECHYPSYKSKWF